MDVGTGRGQVAKVILEMHLTSTMSIPKWASDGELRAKEVVMADEWEWLRQLKPSNELPERLCVPTSSPGLNLGVQVIGSNIVGNDVVELAAQYMAEHARLELWIGSHEPPLGFQQQFERTRGRSEALLAAYEAWVAFETAYQASGKKIDQVRDERERLKGALRRATDALVRARSECSSRPLAADDISG
ncbi:hypothetical protein ACFV06_32580 [Streptomyces sp. NPDC059618]|uniref:hypothetical protein n=1 Tax=Streptomyces sp. NPDC059618 TaxID=3346887 RepID=UPI0036C8C3FA